MFVNEDYVLKHIIDSYLTRFQVDINYLLSYQRKYSPILQWLPIFQYFTWKFYVSLISVNDISMRKNYQKWALINNLSGTTTCLNIIIKQLAVQIGYKMEYHLLKIFFYTTDNLNIYKIFLNILNRKSNWLCENQILKTVIFKNSLRFDMTCCSYLHNILRHEFYFTNGVHCILDKKCIFLR